MDDGVYHYSHDNSVCVSPTSLFNDDGSAGNGFDLGNENSQPVNVATSISSSSFSSSAACNCVQNHAELLFGLKDLEQHHTSPRLDVVLSAAQQALVPWKNVIECRFCQHDDNREVLMLSGMQSFQVVHPLFKDLMDFKTSL